MYLSVISIGEICRGFTIHPECHLRANLRSWLEDELRPWFAGRILPLSESIAERRANINLPLIRESAAALTGIRPQPTTRPQTETDLRD